MKLVHRLLNKATNYDHEQAFNYAVNECLASSATNVFVKLVERNFEERYIITKEVWFNDSDVHTVMYKITFGFDIKDNGHTYCKYKITNCEVI